MTWVLFASWTSLVVPLFLNWNPEASRNPAWTNQARRPAVPTGARDGERRLPRACASCQRHGKRGPSVPSRRTPCSAFPTPLWTGADARPQAAQASSSSISIQPTGTTLARLRRVVKTEQLTGRAAIAGLPEREHRTPGNRLRAPCDDCRDLNPDCAPRNAPTSAPAVPSADLRNHAAAMNDDLVNLKPDQQPDDEETEPGNLSPTPPPPRRNRTRTPTQRSP